MGMSVLVYAVRVSSSVRDPAVRSHMFVQNGQDGCECYFTW